MTNNIIVRSETVSIAAPLELVWQVLTDFERYGEWNRFCPAIRARLEIGSPVEMKVDLGQGLQDQVEYITRLEPPQPGPSSQASPTASITWSMENKPGDPIHADRTQLLTALDATNCSYVTYDVFAGEGAAQMVELLGERVKSGFDLCAINLKERAEAMYQQQAAGGQPA